MAIAIWNPAIDELRQQGNYPFSSVFNGAIASILWIIYEVLGHFWSDTYSTLDNPTVNHMLIESFCLLIFLSTIYQLITVMSLILKLIKHGVLHFYPNAPQINKFTEPLFNFFGALSMGIVVYWSMKSTVKSGTRCMRKGGCQNIVYNFFRQIGIMICGDSSCHSLCFTWIINMHWLLFVIGAFLINCCLQRYLYHGLNLQVPPPASPPGPGAPGPRCGSQIQQPTQSQPLPGNNAVRELSFQEVEFIGREINQNFRRMSREIGRIACQHCRDQINNIFNSRC